jgi:hypothetical protein
MLYGFELFRELRAAKREKVVEVYPYAIVCALIRDCPHKTTPDGYSLQLRAVVEASGWTSVELEAQLRRSVPASKHDRLDAFMAAWVASLDKSRCCAYGDEADPNGAIWIPRQDGFVSAPR